MNLNQLKTTVIDKHGNFTKSDVLFLIRKLETFSLKLRDIIFEYEHNSEDYLLYKIKTSISVFLDYLVSFSISNNFDLSDLEITNDCKDVSSLELSGYIVSNMNRVSELSYCSNQVSGIFDKYVHDEDLKSRVVSDFDNKLFIVVNDIFDFLYHLLDNFNLTFSDFQ